MSMKDHRNLLPGAGHEGTLLGRAWLPAGRGNPLAGPAPVWLQPDGVYDLSATRPTMAALVRDWSSALLEGCRKYKLCELDELLTNTMAPRPDPEVPRLLAPVDLQAVKACGVTFITSLLERVIEERSGGNAGASAQLRAEISALLGKSLEEVKPGSAEAASLKEHLLRQGAWSQYLEVGLGPDAEVFTKCQPLAAVGPGAQVGIHPASQWSNPEPELVLVVDAHGQVRGATLGNDVNLRDIEGRSALLLGKAKDNNASCAIGPCIRMFDDSFGLEELRKETISLEINGTDGFTLGASSSLSKISRDPLELVAQTINASRQFPDGLALFTGTMFAPIDDRDQPGMGFTHHKGDRVRISSPHLGCLENTVTPCDNAAPWTFGIGALMDNLAARGLLR
jgi:fumarylacetoacetate (FAA) hydrolase family protein